MSKQQCTRNGDKMFCTLNGERQICEENQKICAKEKFIYWFVLGNELTIEHNTQIKSGTYCSRKLATATTTTNTKQ